MKSNPSDACLKKFRPSKVCSGDESVGECALKYLKKFLPSG